MRGDGARGTPSSDYFRLLRRTRGLSQRDAADLAHGLDPAVDRAFVAGVERRGIPQTARRFFAYAYSLGVDFRTLQDLQFADKEGLNTIKRLRSEGARVVGASPYIRLLLDVAAVG